MSPVRSQLQFGVPAAILLLAATWAASPLHAAPPSGTVSLESSVAVAPAPKLVKQVKPLYPPEASEARVQGLFVIDVVIGPDGAVKDARLVLSAPTAERLKEITPSQGTAAALEGDQRLAQAALDAVKRWQYEPVVKAGKPVEAKATVTVEFKVAEAKASS